VLAFAIEETAKEFGGDPSDPISVAVAYAQELTSAASRPQRRTAAWPG
jgi:hypothetical protein